MCHHHIIKSERPHKLLIDRPEEHLITYCSLYLCIFLYCDVVEYYFCQTSALSNFAQTHVQCLQVCKSSKVGTLGFSQWDASGFKLTPAETNLGRYETITATAPAHITLWLGRLRVWAEPCEWMVKISVLTDTNMHVIQNKYLQNTASLIAGGLLFSAVLSFLSRQPRLLASFSSEFVNSISFMNLEKKMLDLLVENWSPFSPLMKNILSSNV